MAIFTGRQYAWEAGKCGFMLPSGGDPPECYYIAKKGTYVCKRCWFKADLCQQEDFKLAYQPGDYCLSFACWGVPRPGHLYGEKCRVAAVDRAEVLTLKRIADRHHSYQRSQRAAIAHLPVYMLPDPPSSHLPIFKHFRE